MASTRIEMLRLWSLVGMVVVATWMFSGCATTPRPSGPSVDEVNQRLAALEDCVAHAQEVIEAAIGAGASVGYMAPSSSSVADAQDALDEARQLLQAGKNQEAMDRATQALDDCGKIEAMAMKARDESLEHAAQARMRAPAEARMGQVTPCIAAARQAIMSAEAAGATAQELAAAKSALASAESAFQDAQGLLDQGDVQRALNRLEVAQSDCLAARDMGNQVGVAAASRAAARPKRYTVMRGDTLWGISGRTPIYDSPFMWPLIYKANRDQIRDPDLIYPNQVFAIPRHYSQEEANSAGRRARTRGPWRLGDGPDYYILEGVRR
jgi:nucleoid-associated protein YgaU